MSAKVSAAVLHTFYDEAAAFDRAVARIRDIVNGVLHQARQLEAAWGGHSATAQSEQMAQLTNRVEQLVQLLESPGDGNLIRQGADALANNQQRLRVLQSQRDQDRARFPQQAAQINTLYDYQARQILRDLATAYADVGTRLPTLPSVTVKGTPVPNIDAGPAPLPPDESAAPGVVTPGSTDSGTVVPNDFGGAHAHQFAVSWPGAGGNTGSQVDPAATPVLGRTPLGDVAPGPQSFPPEFVALSGFQPVGYSPSTQVPTDTSTRGSLGRGNAPAETDPGALPAAYWTPAGPEDGRSQATPGAPRQYGNGSDSTGGGDGVYGEAGLGSGGADGVTEPFQVDAAHSGVANPQQGRFSVNQSRSGTLGRSTRRARHEAEADRTDERVMLGRHERVGAHDSAGAGNRPQADGVPAANDTTTANSSPSDLQTETAPGSDSSQTSSTSPQLPTSGHNPTAPTQPDTRAIPTTSSSGTPTTSTNPSTGTAAVPGGATATTSVHSSGAAAAVSAGLGTVPSSVPHSGAAAAVSASFDTVPSSAPQAGAAASAGFQPVTAASGGLQPVTGGSPGGMTNAVPPSSHTDVSAMTNAATNPPPNQPVDNTTLPGQSVSGATLGASSGAMAHSPATSMMPGAGGGLGMQGLGAQPQQHQPVVPLNAEPGVWKPADGPVGGSSPPGVLGRVVQQPTPPPAQPNDNGASEGERND